MGREIRAGQGILPHAAGFLNKFRINHRKLTSCHVNSLRYSLTDYTVTDAIFMQTQKNIILNVFLFVTKGRCDSFPSTMPEAAEAAEDVAIQ